MKIAIVHEWFTLWAGSENVVEQMLACFPEAELHALIDFLPERDRARLANKPVRTSFMQHLPLARSRYRSYLPLMPLAVERFDMSGYDLVISSSHAVAKGVVTRPDQVHVSYIHSPMRYAWDLQEQYLQESGLDRGIKGFAARAVLRWLRNWDRRSAKRVNHLIANSEYIATRIRNAYGRQSSVVYPPVDVASFSLRERKEAHYVAASRLVPYKRVDLIVEAFSAMPDRKLVVIGDGPSLDKARAKAGDNVEFLGHLPRTDLIRHLQAARALVFAAEEDFGILPVEAQACGTPVIAYGRGGALETVRGLDAERPTGVFFPEQSVAAIRAGVEEFEANAGRISPVHCRRNAERFSIEVFRRSFRQQVLDAVDRSRVEPGPG